MHGALSALTVVSIRRAVAVVTVLSLLGVSTPLPAADPERFEAAVVLEFHTRDGDVLKADASGVSTPGGEFTGTLCETLVGFGGHGTVTYEYETGSLTLFFVDTVVSDDMIVGAWTVLEGTGEFAGAEGGGEFTAFFLPDTPPGEDIFLVAVAEVTGTIVR